MTSLEYASQAEVSTRHQTRLYAFLKSSLLVAVSIAILFYRRPDQFLHPYIWVEDGTYNLKAFAENGFWSIFQPVAGYYVLASKLITLAAFKISIWWAPEIAAALVVAFTSGVILTIAFAPTRLPWKPICALVPLLIPTNSEVFAVSEYAFWWAGIWILLALIWDREGGRAKLRLVLLAIGGLSSPIIVPLALLFGIRAAIERNRSEWLCAGLALVLAAVQVVTIHSDASLPGASAKFNLPTFVGRFFGLFIGSRISSEATVIALGWVILLAMAVAALAIGRRLDWRLGLLVGSLLLICVATVVRIPLNAIDPFRAGPRYFFYAFILLGWILLWLAAASTLPLRIALVAIVALGIAQGIGRLPRRHDSIDWSRQIELCANSADGYDIPIHYAGSAADMWHVRLSAAQCKGLIAQSLF